MAVIQGIDLEGIRRAYHTIRPHVIRTPVLTCPELSKLVEAAVFPVKHELSKTSRLKLFLKCENLQTGGSFKFRGASFFLSQLSEVELRAGVVSYSTGNHAIGLTLAAISASKLLGFPIPVQIVMARTASTVKVDKIRSLGAKVLQYGASLSDCASMAEMIRRETGATLIPTSSHPYNSLGQGTAALEFLEQIEKRGDETLDVVIVPSGGASLLAGTAVACHGIQPGIKVFGAEPEIGAADLGRGRAVGRRVTELTGFTIADGLRQPVAACNWDVVSNPALVEGVYAVSDADIGLAMRHIFESTALVVEPSSAVPIAALLFNEGLQRDLAKMYEGRPLGIGIIMTGGNVSQDRTAFNVHLP